MRELYQYVERKEGQVSQEDLAEIKALIDSGIDLNEEDSYIIHSAVTHNHLEVVELLIKSGANINTCLSGTFDDCLYLVADSHTFRAVQYIIDIQSNYKITPLHLAILMNNIEMAELLVKLGADVNTPLKLEEYYEEDFDLYVYDPLHLAVLSKNIEMTELLLKSGADISSQAIKSSKRMEEYYGEVT